MSEKFHIFPTTVLRFHYDNELSTDVLDFINNQDEIVNEGNTTSSDRYVFKNPLFNDLHNFCLKSVNNYVSEVVRPKNSVEVYSTQSWLNYSKPNEYHHRHIHPNSYLSGVFYIDSDNDLDRIMFYDERPLISLTLTLPSDNYVVENSTSWWFPSLKGSLYVFPSSLSHSVHTVPESERRKRRISLSFNTFVKGYIGSEDSLTSLHL